MENIVRYDQYTYSAGYTVILEFPPKSEKVETIQREVKMILEGAMKEYLNRTS